MLGGNPLQVIKNMNRLVFPHIRQTLFDLWDACQDTEMIIYHPKAFGAYDIAEKLGVPVFIAFPIPALTPTAHFSNPILPFTLPFGGPLANKASYSFNRFLTAPFHRLVNDWRKEKLGLPKKSIFRNERVLHAKPIPTIYCCSPSVFTPPPDWDHSNVCVSGYWFLEEKEDWKPPKGLVSFLEEGPPPVCISFSSMPLKHPERFKELALEALRKTGLRGIILTGWSGMAFNHTPPNVYLMESAPHTWLFPKCSVVVHHGGAGTVAAALRAGKPMIICPFTGDQPYWARLMHDLGVAAEPLSEKRITEENLSKAISYTLENREIMKKADFIGRLVRSENGVENAINFIHSKLKASGAL